MNPALAIGKHSSGMLRTVSQSVTAIKVPAFTGRGRARDFLVRRFAEIVTALSFAALLALAVPLHDSAKRSTGAPAAGPRAIDAAVVEVLDGDTILVRIGKKVEKIRLIGIDAPEAVADDKALIDAEHSHQNVQSIVKLGRLASQFTRSIVMPGTMLHITFDRRRNDRYGRLLGYVFLPDNTLLNERLIAEGYASIDPSPPNDKFDERFERAFKVAQSQQKGLWKRKDHRVLEVITD